ncbi:disintegrin and metalloproteinase domain-containing protein 9 [Notechis scutatus]|uniref:Disintegrin and metalloproteinase domain-containing protein 9 n=1 Tax=Notechis scutatus TaxID=8663 RepID=A0A6J1VLY3_9SAUR|nr:disintegrin and metalloproteinase domain-containing protein 9 [Notechis scutatus]
MRTAASARGSALLLLLLLLVLLCPALSFPAEQPGFQSLSHLSSYEIIVPKRIEKEQEREQAQHLEDQLSFRVTVEGKPYTIHLRRHNDLVSQDFRIYTYDESGKLKTETPDLQNHCHYQGYVEGDSSSIVAVSTCFGLRGLVQIQDIPYGIEPINNTLRHAVYRMENVKKAPGNCGVSHPDRKWESGDVQRHQNASLMARRKRSVLQQTRYVELFIVVDKERYNLLGQNKTAVREEMVQLANFLDSIYIMLNIRIVLVGLEIWTSENKIRMEGGAGDVLANFVQWRERELVPRRRHDSAQLVLRKGFGGTAGMAYVGTVCSNSHSGGINVFGPNSLQAFASIVAHELGHNLGMNHDNDRNCHCETGNCIMNSGASGARNFSTCSEEDFEKLTLNKGGSCLLNIPRPDETYSIPYCGNKLVDAGEECDCGSVEECKTDPCCEAGTCRLRSGSGCGYGDCCKDCQYLSKGTVCREKASECDLPEYCNGSSAFCPQDVTIQNGHPCHQDKAYCYDGVCQDYELQCQNIFGPLRLNITFLSLTQVCNSNKNCHCSSDWAPPYCDSPGYGGSIDSGPTYNDNVAARNWILAFVFIALAIVIVVLILYITKNKRTPFWLPLMDTCCRCFRRSDIGRQQVARTECPRNFPYSSRSAASSAVVSSMDQQGVPPRPPPPVVKTSRASEQLFPSRPAPLPPI